MINLSDLRTRVVRPVLRRMGLHSHAASDLVIGTALAESGLCRLVQIRGPAVGIYQCEPATHTDLWESWLRFRPELADKAKEFLAPYPDAVDQLATNLAYATAVCRLHYYRVPKPIPATLEEQAGYWKAYYNTAAGKGTPDHYIRAWNTAH